MPSATDTSPEGDIDPLDPADAVIVWNALRFSSTVTVQFLPNKVDIAAVLVGAALPARLRVPP